MITAKHAQAAGLTVIGGDAVSEALRTWGAMVVYTTAFISRATAESVKAASDKRVPEKTGELLDSGFVSSGASAFGSPDSGSSGLIGGKFSPAIGSIEGTPDYARVIPTISPTFSLKMGNFGTRTFHKYVVGYTADHAAVVHENPHGAQFQQPPTTSIGRTMKFNHPKKSHFLLDAYNEHREFYSMAMYRGIQQTINAMGAIGRRQTAAINAQAKAASSGFNPSMQPRPRKPGG